MSIALLRRNSDTPTVRGQDDARILRYAVGGQNGYIKGYGDECSHIVSGRNFTVRSGDIIVDGWQCVVDSSGETVTVEQSPDTLYYSVYLDIDLRVVDAQVVSLKAVYALVDYPAVEDGDDLTENPTGHRKFLLYTFTVSNGQISNVSKKFQQVLYLIQINEKPQITQIYQSDKDKMYAGIAIGDSTQDKHILGAVHKIEVGSTVYGVLCPSYRSSPNTALPIFPTGSKVSIAKVEFDPGDWQNYLDIQYEPITNENYVSFQIFEVKSPIYQSYWEDGVKIQGTVVESEGSLTRVYNYTYHEYPVKCHITDLYGNRFDLTWRLSFTTRTGG